MPLPHGEWTRDTRQKVVEVSLKAVSPAGTTYAELDVPRDIKIEKLKIMLEAACQVPVELQRLIFNEQILEDSNHMAAYIGDSTALNLTMVVTRVAYAFASGRWAKVCVTGEGPEVLHNEEIGEEIIIKDNIIKIEQAFEWDIIDGDGIIWAKWGTPVTLQDVAVLGLRLRMPRNKVWSCTLGLTVEENFDSVRGGFSTWGNCKEWAIGSALTYTPSNPYGEGVLHCGGREEKIIGDRLVQETSDDAGGGVHVLLAFHRARQEVLISLGGQRTRVHVPEDMWPADGELFPFVAVEAEQFCGFECVDQANLPILVQALNEEAARTQAADFFSRLPPS